MFFKLSEKQLVVLSKQPIVLLLGIFLKRLKTVLVGLLGVKPKQSIVSWFQSIVILPIDRNVGALPRQTWIGFCAVLASVFHRDSPQEPAKEQNGAAAADHAPTPKSATEPPITKSKSQEL